MKIGFITPGGFDRSGRERIIPVFLGLVERLARQHEAHVYTLDQRPEPDDYALAGAHIHNIGYAHHSKRRREQWGRALRALHGEHRRRRFDVLHGLWASRSGLIAALAGKMLRVPSVVSVAGGELIALPEIGYGAQSSRSGRLRAAWSLRLATAVTGASGPVLRALLPYRPDARHIILGADCARFAPPEVPPPGPPWRLLHIASLNRVKDQPTLLRAFQRIAACEPAAHLDIIGEDTLDGAIQRLARELGLSEAVTFHGFQPVEVVAARLRESHLLLHSSRHEAGPMVVLEAAACGVPTAGTAVGAITDLAPEAASAVPVGDAEALAQSALALLHDPSRRQEMGRSALAFARAHDLAETARQFAALYAELAAGPLP